MEKIKKIYNRAPLPFQGQKRNFIKDFKKVLATYPDDITIVDLFGGSGLLSLVAKAEKPNAEVIYNDYDNYCERLENIPSTNILLSKINDIIGTFPKSKRLPMEKKEQIIDLIDKEAKKGNFIDYITLSSALLFSTHYVTNLEDLKKETFYKQQKCNSLSHIKTHAYSAEGYLDDIKVVRMDYKELFEKYKDKSNVLFLLDPPYLSTNTGTYKMYWKLKDYLDVLTILNGHNFIFFTTNKSSLVELLEWIQEQSKSFALPKIKRVDRAKTLTHNAEYIDTMLISEIA